MTTHNDITGDTIMSKPLTDAYRNSPFWETRKVTTHPDTILREEGIKVRKAKDAKPTQPHADKAKYKRPHGSNHEKIKAFTGEY